MITPWPSLMSITKLVLKQIHAHQHKDGTGGEECFMEEDGNDDNNRYEEYVRAERARHRQAGWPDCCFSEKAPMGPSRILEDLREGPGALSTDH